MTKDRSACRPPQGSTYLAIGQDLFSIQQYVNAQFNASLHRGSLAPMSSFFPAAVMSYTDLETLRGLNRPTDYGSGIEYADGILESLFPGYKVGLQIGLWLSGSHGCSKINGGKMDGQIRKLVDYLGRCPATKVFLRIGYEFDNPSFGYASDPDSYVRAYRRIVNACRAGLSKKRLGNVYFVWHSWGAPTSPGVKLGDFFPGDNYVDWVGVSIFQQLYPWAKPWDGSMVDVERVMDFASGHGKPTMIAESTPFGGIDLKTNETKLYHLEDPWDRWFQPVLDLIDRYDVSMWCYINCAWDEQPMWHGVGFGETRLSTSNKVMRKWRELVLKGGDGDGRGRNFLTAGSLENCASERGEVEHLQSALVSLDGKERSIVKGPDLGASYSLQHILGPEMPIGVGFGVTALAMCVLATLLLIGGYKLSQACNKRILVRRVRIVEQDTVSETTPMYQQSNMLRSVEDPAGD